MVTFPDAQDPASRTDPLLGLLLAAGVRAGSRVRVTGPSGLSALMWLCRHGFEDAGYVKPGSGPHEDADAVIVAHTCDAGVLARLLATGPQAATGGLLIVRSPLPDVGDTHDPIHALLEQHGYRVETCVHGRHRELHIARRVHPRLARAA